MRDIRSVIQMLFGNALAAIAFGSIIIPRGFASGGTTGLAMILADMIPLSLPVIVMMVNVVLFLIGLVLVGKAFAMKTIVCMFSFPYLLSFFQRFYLFPSLDPVLAAIMAGVLLGTGTLLILHAGGSTGGFDVIGMILQEKRGIPAWVVLYGADALLIGKQMFSGGLEMGILGIFVTLTACVVTGTVSNLHRNHEKTMQTA